MTSGARPKIYPPELVERVATLYAHGLTQTEIAPLVGLTQKVIFNVMRRHGIKSRPAIKRNQFGPKNSTWKGSKATYAALHKRVEVARGRPAKCGRCGASGPGRTYDWANLTGAYDDIADFERMCRSCHRVYDAQRID